LGTFAVLRQVAGAVARQLSQRRVPRWMVFRDLSTAFHRISRGDRVCVAESTAEQRAASRAFWRARRLEAKAGHRPWEDDG
jgi:hypothetical protein